MKSLQIYDPAMCCSTGVCGPNVDQRLVHLADDVAFLQDRGVRVERYNLGHQLQAFARNPLVLDEMGAKGEHLPLFIVEGEIKAKGRYPDRRELADWVGLEGGGVEDQLLLQLNVVRKGCC